MFVGMLLLLVIPCVAEQKVRFKGQWSNKSKSLTPIHPLQAWIEDDNRSLSLEFHSNIGIVIISVTNSNGDTIYSQVVNTESTPAIFISLPRDIEQGDVLSVKDDFNNIYGNLFINSINN